MNKIRVDTDFLKNIMNIRVLDAYIATPNFAEFLNENFLCNK